MSRKEVMTSAEGQNSGFGTFPGQASTGESNEDQGTATLHHQGKMSGTLNVVLQSKQTTPKSQVLGIRTMPVSWAASSHAVQAKV